MSEFAPTKSTPATDHTAAIPESHERQDQHGQHAHADAGDAAPWKPVQARAVGKLAATLRTPAVALPHRTALEASFGRDLGDITAHVGERAAVCDLGGMAAAEGNVVAFAETSPSLATVAHEVTHVVQARSGTGGTHVGAEAEAERAEANIEAGAPVGAITQGASGIHLKQDGAAPPEADKITAREFLRELGDIQTVVLHALFLNKVAELHPFARYLTTPEVLLESMFGYGTPGGALMNPFPDKIDGLIAPEPMAPLVDKARRAESSWGAVIGPAHPVYMESVGFELGNALTRTFKQSLTRMLPRYALAARVEKTADGVDAPTIQPLVSDLAVSHPLDRIVAHALCSPALRVDAAKFATEHPEIVKAQAPPQSRSVALKFPYERNLWHWVEASPADATAEDVARELFGNEDQAYRLTPMAPLFGFRTSDVGSFVEAKRLELNALAAAHHPHPELANQAEIAAIQSSHAQWDGYGPGHGRDAEPGFAMFDGPDGGMVAQDAGPEHGTAPSKVPDPIYAYPTRDDVDPALELAAAEGANKLAVQRAKLAAGPGDGKRHDETSVYDRAQDCLDLLAPTEQAFAALGLSGDGIATQRASFMSTQRKALETCFADADGEYQLLDQRAKILKDLSQGAIDTAAHLPLYGGVNKDAGSMLPSPKDLPDFARAPLEEAGAAFASALAALAFPELARPRVDRALYLQKMLRISVLENSLHQTRPVLQDAMDTPDDRRADTAAYNPQRMETTNNHLLAELSVARVQMENDPAAAETTFASTQERAGDYSFEVAIVSNLEALDSVWGAIEGTEDFWKSGMDTALGNMLQSRNRTFYNKFKTEVFEPYRTAVTQKDKAGKDAAKKVFKDLVESDGFQQHFKQVQQHIKDDANHKKWTKIIVGIAIAVVAMGLGQWYFGVYLAAGGGVLGAAVGAAVIETGVGTILNKMILDVDPTAGGLIVGMIGAGAMYGVLGKTLVAARAAGATAEVAEAATKASLLQRGGKLALDTTKEVIMVQAIGMLQGQITNLIDHGTLLSEAQLKEMFIHNIAGLVGMKIGQRLVDVTIDPMKPLRELGKRNAIDIDALGAEHAALTQLAEKIALAKEGERPALAQELVAREKIFLEKMRDARERLIELAEKNPGKYPAGQLEGLKAMPERVQDAETIQAQAMMSLEEVGPNLYRADARAFDTILSLHKDSGDRLVGVHTDAKTGLRTLEIETVDGGRVKIKEKLGDVGERSAPPIPVDEAQRFEHWLENEMAHPDPAQLDLQRQRLREYYARDPQGALALADRYGFRGQSTSETAPLATTPAAGGPEHPTVQPKAESDRAYDQFLYEKRGGDEPKMSRMGEEPVMSRSDFEALYKAGYEYDPVARRMVLAEGRTTSTGKLGTLDPTPAGSEVLGTVHSEAVGLQALRKLVAGEAEALRMVGIEPTPGFDSRGNEWGLGRRTADGEIVLVRGGKGEVNWDLLPGIEPLAHSHPLVDPITGATRTLEGRNGQAQIDASNPLALAATATHSDLIYFLPSTGDLRFVALGGKPHAVATPFISLGEGKIGNPHAGMNADTVDIHIASAEAIGTYGTTPGGDMVVYKGKVRVMAGEREIGSYDIYQTFHNGIGDLPSFVAPPHYPLPANHPIAKATSTPSSHSTPIGHVQPMTVARLMAMGMADPAGNPSLMRMLGGLDAEGAGQLAFLAREAVSGRVKGLSEWLANMESLGGKQLKNSLVDLEVAAKQLADDPGLQLQLTPDGQLRFTDPAISPVTPAKKSVETIADDVRAQVAREKPSDFEWTWSDVDTKRVIVEGQKLGLTDRQINDLIRIAQRKDQPQLDGTIVIKKITPDEMVQQMKNYVEVVLPQGHPYRFESRESFLEFSREVRGVVSAAGLPTTDIRVQGSALRKTTAKDIDIAILIDDRVFDGQLLKLFEGKVTKGGKQVNLEYDTLGDLVTAIRKDEAAGGIEFNSKARTLANAYEKRTIRSQDAPGVSAAKRVLEKKYGDLDVTIMSSGGYLDREPTMVLP